MAFTPAVTAPIDALLDRMEAILRSGDALIHDPLPPAWAAGDPCPAGHYCLPEGATLYRYEAPDEVESEQGTVIVIGCDTDMTQRHLEDDRYWLVGLTVKIIQARDVEVTGNAASLLEDLFTLFTVDAATQTATARLSSAAVHVYYLQEKDVKPDTIVSGRNGHEFTFTAFCSGITPPVTPP